MLILLSQKLKVSSEHNVLLCTFFRVVTLIFVSMCLVLMVYFSVTLMLSRLPLLSLLSILVAQCHFHLFIIFPLDIQRTHFSH